MVNNDMIAAREAALEKARNELSHAFHLADCGKNAGIRKMNANKAEWLSQIVYLAEAQIAREESENDKKGAIALDVLNTSYIEEETLSETICMDEGPNQFKTVKYRPTCVHGCIDCVWDPAYIYATYPSWYKKLYGDARPGDIVCENCKTGERYDDEDK